MKESPGLHNSVVFTHQLWDSVAGIPAFCTNGAIEVDRERGVALETVVVAPARSASVTSDQLGLVLRIYPRECADATTILAKGRNQYRLFQPDPAHLSFQIQTDSLYTLTCPIPENWYGTWHTISACYNGAALQLFVDGNPIGTCAASGFIRYAPGQLVLGTDPFTGQRGSGVIAALQVYDRVSSEITSVDPPSMPEENCLLDFRFDEWDTAPEALSAATPERPAPSSTEHPWQHELDGWVVDETMTLRGELAWYGGPREEEWSNVEATWEITENGNVTSSGPCRIVWNGELGVARIIAEYPMPEFKPETMYLLSLNFSRITESATTELGCKQIPLRLDISRAPGPLLGDLPHLEIHEKNNTGYFKGEDFEIELDLPTATIVAWRADGEDLLELGPIHQLWRAPTREAVLDGTTEQWVEAGFFENMMGVTAMEALQSHPAKVVLDFKGLIIRRDSSVLYNVERSYAIYGDGEVVLRQRLNPAPGLPNPQRAGFELRLPKDLTRLTWLDDKHESNRVDQDVSDWRCGFIHEAPVMDSWQGDPDIKKGARWVSLRNASGRGLIIGSEASFEMSVSPHSEFQRSEAIWPETLTPDSAFTLHLDQPIGQGISTPVEYRIRPTGADDKSPWTFLNRGLPQEEETE